jgi:hypothetical protein
MKPLNEKMSFRTSPAWRQFVQTVDAAFATLQGAAPR